MRYIASDGGSNDKYNYSIDKNYPAMGKKIVSQTIGEAAKKNAKPNDAKLANIFQDINYDVNILIRDLIEEENIDENMIGKQRRRLIGSGVRNYGFIEKPKVVSGVRKVVDEVSRGRAAVKETAEAEVRK
jgi:hypothetical protein